MSYTTIILIAFALSVDACVVSFSYGLVFEKERLKNSTLLALFTSGFQGLMPVLAYFPSKAIENYISQYADLLVCLIFTYLGIKFIIEAFKKEKEKSLCIDLKCLTLIGIATSIDAFSAGITLALRGNHIFKPAILIAFITLINSYLGFFAGTKTRRFPSKILEIFAGVILIFLGMMALK